jgi:ferredoxin-NADP reductase
MTAIGWETAEVIATRPLTESSRSIRLAVHGWTTSLPGQHVDLRLTAEDGYKAVRSYSLASTGEDNTIELGVDRLPDGEVSPYLVDDLEVGDQLEVRGPLGGWFVWHATDTRPVQLVAGGSGVVPLVAMIRARAAAREGAPLRLLYSVRSPADALYREFLEDPPSGTAVDWIYTRQPPPGWPRAAGRLGSDDLDDHTFAVADEPLIFVCGSTPFAERVSGLLIDRGHAADTIRIERYGGI